MTAIATLIDKQDGFEVIRDKIAALLVENIAAQKALATAAGKDPTLWDVRIFVERSNPWEIWLNSQTDTRPICNIWFDSSAFPEGTGNVVERQNSQTVYNIDLYGYGQSADDATGGHTAGDKKAATECHRAIKLVRNILMAGQYTYLELRGTVWQRWITSITAFQPEFDGRAIQNVVGARIAFNVSFNELSPQVEATTLEYISTTCKRTEDDEIILQVDFDYS